MRRRELLLAMMAPAGMVTRWDVITIGNLSRNRYWGEGDDKAMRPVLCTSTLIRGEGFCLLVDPSQAKAEDMATELNRRTGLRLDDVNAVFITHEHGDHTAGLEHFPRAAWYASGGTAEKINASKKLGKAVSAAPAVLFGAVEVMATPGHTRDHHALRFSCGGRWVIVAGDAVATRDFWLERRSFFNAVDPGQGARTMEEMARKASVIVPGHDNYFLV